MNLTDSPFQLEPDGWCRGLPRVACTNFDQRPDGSAISLLVIHNISLPPGEFGGSYIQDLFANRLDVNAHPYFAQLRDLRVSAHFLIRRDGRALQFVSTLARAWHAGQSYFDGRERCNDFSVGIELEGTDSSDFCDAQYQTLAELSHALCIRHPLVAVRGHEHIAPGRKTDPGPHFDWRRFHSDLVALQKNQVSEVAAGLRLPSFPA